MSVNGDLRLAVTAFYLYIYTLLPSTQCVLEQHIWCSHSCIKRVGNTRRFLFFSLFSSRLHENAAATQAQAIPSQQSWECAMRKSSRRPPELSGILDSRDICNSHSRLMQVSKKDVRGKSLYQQTSHAKCQFTARKRGKKNPLPHKRSWSGQWPMRNLHTSVAPAAAQPFTLISPNSASSRPALNAHQLRSINGLG